MDDLFIDVDDATIRRERDKARVLRKQGWWQSRVSRGVCHYCGRNVPPKELTLDHVVPLTRGGRSTRGNCVPACKECNNQKKHLLPMEWVEHLQRLKDQ
jgi:5-methylcytosine-specific restriction endonuclease McrA